MVAPLPMWVAGLVPSGTAAKRGTRSLRLELLCSFALRCPECGANNLPEAEHCVACGDVLAWDDEPAIDPRIGRVLAGKLRLEAILGEGSMGCVYAARQLDLDGEVAVKVLHDHVAADPKVAKRFHREARTASRLTHPNTLRVFDFGREDEGKLLYLVMELLDGPDLLELTLAEGPLSPRRIDALVGGVLAALEEAHDGGIVHRDLKPENILVVTDYQGREHPKVCDFGLAKLVEAQGSAITMTGFVCGTPEYMAPEQARGEPLDARADLYAVGCLLYLLLTGEVPFKGASALATITEHLTRRVDPPSQRAPARHVPHALEQVCLRAMRKERDERFADAGEMRLALHDAVNALGALADRPLGSFAEDPTRPTQPSRWRWWHGALGAGALLGAVSWVATREPPARSVEIARPERAPTIETSTRSSMTGALDEPRPVDPHAAEADATDTSAPSAGSVARDGGSVDPGAIATRDEERRPTSERPRSRTGLIPPPTATTRSEPSDADDGSRLFEEGRRAFRANDLELAMRSFETAARLRPRDPEVHKQLGRAFMRAGNVERAREAYARYLALAPSAPDRAIVERILAE